MLVAVTVLIVAGVVAFDVSSGSPRAKGVAAPVSSPAAPAPPATLPAQPPRPFPSTTADLVAGSYATTMFQPALTFTVGSSWRVLSTETPEFFEIAFGTGPVRSISFVHLTRVLASTGTYHSADDAVQPGALQPVPADVIGWLAANPNLTTGVPLSVNTAGATGSSAEVTVRAPYASDLCHDPCVPLCPFQDARLGYGVVVPTNRQLVYALDIAGQKVLAIVLTSADQYPAFAPEAERVVATVRPSP